MKANCISDPASRPSSTFEPLEARIAPAATLVSATMATYTDVDGDKVTMKFSAPVLTLANVTTILVTASFPGGDQLQTINLTGVVPTAKDTDISISAKRVDAGDGFANVGYINATGVPLGKVPVSGDLGAIAGALGSVKVKGDVKDAYLHTTSGATDDFRLRELP